MDPCLTELLELVPCRLQKIPARLDEAYRRAKAGGLVVARGSPDGEEWVERGSGVSQEAVGADTAEG